VIRIDAVTARYSAVPQACLQRVYVREYAENDLQWLGRSRQEMTQQYRGRADHVHEVSSGTPRMPERPLRDTQAALHEP
jgi:hypothetical protein